MKKYLLVATLWACGCATSTPTPATSHATTERVSAASPAATTEIVALEFELLLNLWLHTKQEEKRLRDIIDDPETPQAKQDAARVLLVTVERQAQETWISLFRN